MYFCSLKMQRYCGFSSAGRAEASQASGRGFEPRNPLMSRKLSSVGSERLPYKQEVAGSNPAVSTKKHPQVGAFFIITSVTPPGFEPGPKEPESLILSIRLRGLIVLAKLQKNFQLSTVNFKLHTLSLIITSIAPTPNLDIDAILFCVLS